MGIENAPNKSSRKIEPRELEAGITPDLIQSAEDYLRILAEEKERDTASFSLTIDKAAITKTLEETKNPDEQRLLKTFNNLPETLTFEPGITLIIGANASGKTTLAKSIYLATEFQHEIESIKKSSAEAIITGYSTTPRHQVDSFLNVEPEARKRVLNHGSSPYMSVWHASAGLASKISGVFQAFNFFSKGRPYYIDTPAIVGAIRSKDEEQYDRNTRVSIEDIAIAGDRGDKNKPRPQMSQQEAQDDIRKRNLERGSTRQTLDKQLPTLFSDDFGEPYSPSVFFFDEPEVGLDVFRHQKIIEETLALTEGKEHAKSPRSITIIPTNSLKLFESDLPRIDLRYPERGIFRPSEYPPEE